MNDLTFLKQLGLFTAEGYASPLKGELKIVKNGVIFQQFCRNGLPYDIAISMLQKAIRRGELDVSLYACYQIVDLGKIFVSHLLNRLVTILSEDIGPAEPGLATIMEPVYTSLYHNRDDPELVHNEIIRIVTLLTGVRKSRITDLLIHDSLALSESEHLETLESLPETLEEAVQWAVYLSESHQTSGAVTYVYNGTTYSKSLYIYRLWQLLLEETISTPIYDDTVSLLKIYEQRGIDYGLLTLVHALSLYYFQRDGLLPVLLQGFPYIASRSWEDLGTLQIPVMNYAVDMHTYYGRKHLGRGEYDFFLHGTKLENWTPLYTESTLSLKFIQQHAPEISNTVPRIYQTGLISKCVDHLRHKESGWLVMACGTGKTNTSYWITRDLCQNKVSYLVVVVLPLLEILRQFYPSWSQLNRQYRNESLSAIVASSSDSFIKSEYSNYQYITTDTELERHLALPTGHKFIFTTYKSVDKVIKGGVKPDLVIYDEAHHVQPCHIFGDKQLFLTATPPSDYLQYGPLITRYSFPQAIGDGMLTNYNINIFRYAPPEDGDEDELYLECIRKIMQKCSKVIVYCSKNTIAYNLYKLCKDASDTTVTKLYINCKTGKSDRIQIFREYAQSAKAIIFNCAILGEGVDFPDCDGVYIHSGYVSDKRVIQAVGRPLRLHATKSIAQVFMMKDKGLRKRLGALAGFDSGYKSKVAYITV